MAQIFRDNHLNQKFLRNGYVTIPLLSREEVNRLLDEIKQLTPSDNFDIKHNSYLQVPMHITTLDSNIEYKRATNKLLRDAVETKLDSILVDRRTLLTQLMIKQPGDGTLPVHQDWTVTKNLDDYNLNIWCPLVDVDARNGAMIMIEGSQRQVRNFICPNSTPFYTGYINELGDYSTTINMKAGEALIFDNTILHASHPNKSDAARVAAVFQSVPINAQPALYYLNADGGFDVFEMDPNAFVEHTGKQLLECELRTNRLCTVPNTNRDVSKQDFVRILNAALPPSAALQRKFATSRKRARAVLGKVRRSLGL